MPPVVIMRIDARETLSFLQAMNRQAPFAISLAINNSVKGAQEAEREHIRGAFILRRQQFIERTVKIPLFATKQHPTAILEIDPSRDLLSKFEAGGPKRPHGGQHLAVPIAVRRNKSDIVIKNMRVRSLGLTAYRTKSGAVQLKGKFRTFAIKLGHGTGAILQRVGRHGRGGSNLSADLAAGSIKVLYAFVRSVPLPAKLDFLPIVTSYIKGNWARHMGEAWNRAIATAR